MSSALVTEESPPPAFLSLPVAAFSSQTDRRPDSRSTVALMSTTGRAAVSGRMKGPGQAPRRLSRPAPKRGGDAASPTPESPDTPPPLHESRSRTPQISLDHRSESRPLGPFAPRAALLARRRRGPRCSLRAAGVAAGGARRWGSAGATGGERSPKTSPQLRTSITRADITASRSIPPPAPDDVSHPLPPTTINHQPPP
ncbi:unnamed protein product [Lampetra fluviatilis]